MRPIGQGGEQEVVRPIAASWSSSSPYFDGQVNIRLLSVLVETNGWYPSYAGSTPSAREAWVVQQRSIMDQEFRFSTYGKLGFDLENSRVVTRDLTGVSKVQHPAVSSSSGCSRQGFDLLATAACELSESVDMNDIDAILYYLPESATESCASNPSNPTGGGIMGSCYTGILRKNSGDPYVSTTYKDISGDASSYWWAGCFVRNQLAGKAEASVGTGPHRAGACEKRLFSRRPAANRSARVRPPPWARARGRQRRRPLCDRTAK